jgi:hypothetical protein
MTNAVQKIDAEPVADLTSGLLAVIERAARDPAVDIDKMERLIAMQERVSARNAEVAFAEAFAELQPDLPAISKNGQIVHKGQVISEFAEWEDINKAITPVLSARGFSLSFKPEQSGSGVAVTGILRHRLGHHESATLSLPTDTSGAKNAVQSVGSTLSYGKRYVATLLLNLTTEGDDDDGSSAAPKQQHAAPRDLPFPNGPARNKSDLKAKARDVWRDIEAITDMGSLAATLDTNAQLFEQLKAVLPEWWNGGTGPNGAYEGLGHVIERVRRDLEIGEQAAAFGPR